ncbi:MAG: hypothetical protein EXS00_03790 [Phycisphaerales bacterium]|nr:hypothetical protein [Phycisphaerales bacterium]
MLPDEVATVTEAVRRVGELIQPELLPHPELTKRNAFAHIWLGIKTVFGDSWRDRAGLAGVLAFVEWIGAHPNADYQDYRGPVELACPKTAELPKPEPTLFD